MADLPEEEFGEEFRDIFNADMQEAQDRFDATTGGGNSEGEAAGGGAASAAGGTASGSDSSVSLLDEDSDENLFTEFLDGFTGSMFEEELGMDTYVAGGVAAARSSEREKNRVARRQPVSGSLPSQASESGGAMQGGPSGNEDDESAFFLSPKHFFPIFEDNPVMFYYDQELKCYKPIVPDVDDGAEEGTEEQHQLSAAQKGGFEEFLIEICDHLAVLYEIDLHIEEIVAAAKLEHANLAGTPKVGKRSRDSKLTQVAENISEAQNMGKIMQKQIGSLLASWKSKGVMLVPSGSSSHALFQRHQETLKLLMPTTNEADELNLNKVCLTFAYWNKTHVQCRLDYQEAISVIISLPGGTGLDTADVWLYAITSLTGMLERVRRLDLAMLMRGFFTLFPMFRTRDVNVVSAAEMDVIANTMVKLEFARSIEESRTAGQFDLWWTDVKTTTERLRSLVEAALAKKFNYRSIPHRWQVVQHPAPAPEEERPVRICGPTLNMLLCDNSSKQKEVIMGLDEMIYECCKFVIDGAPAFTEVLLLDDLTLTNSETSDGRIIDCRAAVARTHLLRDITRVVRFVGPGFVPSVDKTQTDVATLYNPWTRMWGDISGMGSIECLSFVNYTDNDLVGFNLTLVDEPRLPKLEEVTLPEFNLTLVDEPPLPELEEVTLLEFEGITQLNISPKKIWTGLHGIFTTCPNVKVIVIHNSDIEMSAILGALSKQEYTLDLIVFSDCANIKDTDFEDLIDGLAWTGTQVKSMIFLRCSVQANGGREQNERETLKILKDSLRCNIVFGKDHAAFGMARSFIPERRKGFLRPYVPQPEADWFITNASKAHKAVEKGKAKGPSETLVPAPRSDAVKAEPAVWLESLEAAKTKAAAARERVAAEAAAAVEAAKQTEAKWFYPVSILKDSDERQGYRTNVKGGSK